MPRTKVVDMDLVGSVEGGPAPLVPPGRYQAVLADYRSALMFGKQAKLILNFRIIGGEHDGTVVAKFYNVKRLKSKAGRNCAFTVGRHSDYTRDYVRLHGHPSRWDRMPMRAWRNSVYLIDVTTVTTDYQQRTVPKSLQYSRVARIIEKVAGP